MSHDQFVGSVFWLLIDFNGTREEVADPFETGDLPPALSVRSDQHHGPSSMTVLRLALCGREPHYVTSPDPRRRSTHATEPDGLSVACCFLDELYP